LEVEDGERVVGVYHSHPDGLAEPSMADRTSCEATGVPWYIVSYPAGGYQCVQPCGYEAPYLDRVYVHGVHDCYSIIRDWYRREWKFELPDYERRDEWWLKGQNLYVENFEAAGFVHVPDAAPQRGDVFLIQLRSAVPNHAAINLG